VVGLCGMAMFGRIDDPERLYPMVMRTVLQPGLLGLVLASFFAAFMSTESTQLNWGASLVVNDFLRRFAWKGRSERQYLVAGQVSVLVLAVFGALASFAVKDIAFAWKLIISVTAGVGSVYIARWYWWRVNAWSEISAMAGALVCTFVLSFLARDPRMGDHAFVRFPYSTAVTVLVTTPLWVIVTLLTRPVAREHLVRFYERVYPGGAGWRTIRRDIPGARDDTAGARALLKTVCGIFAIYLVLFGIGSLVMGNPVHASVLLAAAFAAGLALFALMRAS
jgi:SSS family solute:Na+ symporter